MGQDRPSNNLQTAFCLLPFTFSSPPHPLRLDYYTLRYGFVNTPPFVITLPSLQLDKINPYIVLSILLAHRLLAIEPP